MSLVLLGTDAKLLKVHFPKMLSCITSAFLLLVSRGIAQRTGDLKIRTQDPCAAVAGQDWVAPEDVRACFMSFPVDPEIKENVNPPLSEHTLICDLLNYVLFRRSSML